MAAKDQVTDQNRLDAGDSVQVETGPGQGTLEGSVPWGEVFREYEETETRSAQRENLSAQERQWVDDYYAILTDTQE